jgi:hypothetical protein
METAPRSSKGRTALTVAGGIVLLLGAIVVAAGGAVLWQTGKSDGGYISSDTHRFDTTSHAIVTENFKVDSDVPRWLIARTRITATSSDGKPVFIGVARKRDVDAYLANVSRSQIRNLEYGSFRVDYTNRGGTASPARPASRSIWAASTSGTGDQQLTWRIRSGQWRVVLMNADGSSGVSADVKVGGTINHVLAAALGITGGGLLILLFGAGVIYAGRGRGRGGHAAVPVTA